ncbi:hypothetical protein Tco_1419638 [Tanacetum coccineum]
MTRDLSLGVVKFTDGINEIAYKMPHKIEKYDSPSDLEKEHSKSVYLRNKKDKRRGVKALPIHENMSDDQKETRGMFKNIARALHKFAKMLKKGLELEELPPETLSLNDPHVTTMNNWPPGPSNLSPPARVSRPPPRFPQPQLGFEHPQPSQPLFININNNAPQLENTQNLPLNLGNQDSPNPPNNILDFIHANGMPYLHNMFS